ncbi:hypothetical protein [Arthrobacter sp. 754]|uniref:hypothetical protein n=1 Tax=Arthrobacter sp. 754 TaxID=3156315 RepID=UPI003398F0FE
MPERHIMVQRRMSASPRSVWALYADTKNQPSALVPFKQAESMLTLEPDDHGTLATFSYRYVPRGGLIGRVTGPLIDRMLTATFTNMLASTDEAAQANG